MKQNSTQGDIFIKYTFKRKSDGHIWEQETPIECLEGKGDKPFILTEGWADFWELIERTVVVKKDAGLNPEKKPSDEIPVVLYRKNWVTLMGCIDNSINNIKESRAEIERAYSRIRHAVTGADAAINQIELGIIELDDIKTIIHNKL